MTVHAAFEDSYIVESRAVQLVAEVMVFLSELGGFLLEGLEAPFEGLGGGPLGGWNLAA